MIGFLIDADNLNSPVWVNEAIAVISPRRCRNTVPAQAMVELNAIDTMGYGIHEMQKDAGAALRFIA